MVGIIYISPPPDYLMVFVTYLGLLPHKYFPNIFAANLQKFAELFYLFYLLLFVDRTSGWKSEECSGTEGYLLEHEGRDIWTEPGRAAGFPGEGQHTETGGDTAELAGGRHEAWRKEISKVSPVY